MNLTRLPFTLLALIALAMALPSCSTTDTPEQPNTTTADPNPFSDIRPGVGSWPDLATLRVVGDPGPADRWEAANLDTKARLLTVVSLSKKDLKLEDAVDFIRDTTGVNIAINWPALELVGIDQDTLSAVSLKEVPAEQFLDIVLEQASADAFDDDKAGFIIEHGVVKVSTIRDLERSETRVYDVRPLLYQTERLQASLYRNHERAEELIRLLNQDTWLSIDAMKPGFDLNETLSSTNSGGSAQNQGGGDGGIFGKDAENKGQAEPEECVMIEERIDVLISVIQTTVADPDEWVEETHTIIELNGNLIINTTRDDHEEITALLDALRKLQTQHFKTRARSIEVFLLLQDAEAFRLNQQYEPALDKIEQALRVDPKSVEALTLKEIITATQSR